jgi:transposase InsO family protein
MSRVRANILDGNFLVKNPHTVFSMDLSTIEKAIINGVETPLSMFQLIDVATGKIMAFLLEEKNKITAQMVTDAVRQVLINVIPHQTHESKVLLHSDRGIHFMSKAYQNLENEFSGYVKLSMSRQATPTDNAVSESWFKTIKGTKEFGILLLVSKKEKMFMILY